MAGQIRFHTLRVTNNRDISNNIKFHLNKETECTQNAQKIEPITTKYTISYILIS